MDLLHISDLHIPSNVTENVKTWKQYTGKLNLKFGRGKGDPGKILEVMKRKVDHVLVTGDLVNVSSEEEYQEARKVILKGLEHYCKDCDVSERSKVLYEKASIIPGNHDAYTEISVNKRYFQTYFGEFCWPEDGNKEFPYLKILEDKNQTVAILGLNSAIPTSPFIASGDLSQEQIDQAKKSLSSIKTDKALYIICLIHHPPLKRFSRLTEYLGMLSSAGKERLQLLCQECKINLVLYGHTHKFHMDIIGDNTLAIDCGSTGYQPHSHLVYRIKDGKLNFLKKYTWNESKWYKQLITDIDVLNPKTSDEHNESYLPLS